MGLRVGDFTAGVQRGGSLKLNETGQGLKTFAQNFKGKVAAFFQGLFHPGQVARDNRAVMNAFITAVRQDPRYGDSFGDLAATSLAHAIRGGKPLNQRTVRRVVQQLDQAKANNVGFTRFQAMVVSENEDTRPGTFGSLFADEAGRRGLPVLTQGYDTRALSEDIREDVMREGGGGVRMVTQQRAQQIAQAKITAFFDAKERSLQTVATAFPNAGPERTSMEKAALRLMSPVKPKAIACAKDLLEPAKALLDKFCDPGCSDVERLREAKTFLEAVQTALGTHYDEVGSDDLNDVLLLSLHYASGLSGKGAQDFERAFGIGSRGMESVRSGLGVHLSGRYARDQEGMENLRKAGNALTLLSRLGEVLGQQAGYASSTASASVNAQELRGPEQISTEGRLGMEALGVPVPH
jgi:hypothetical protein